MIRPLTIASCLLACGSGLYLYQEKHEVQLLDRTIERTVHDTAAMREQSRLLAAEWTMLNDPERLRQFADTYLSLKTIAPSQFTSLADLDSRLPASLPEAPSHGSDEQEVTSVAAETVPPGAPDQGRDTAPPADAAQAAPAAVVDEDLPVPPVPAVPRTPAVASAAHPADIRAPDRVAVSRPMSADGQARPAAIAEARPPDQRPADPRVPERPPIQQSMAADSRLHTAAFADSRPADQRPADPRLQDRPPIQQSMAANSQPHPAAFADGRPFDPRPSEPHATPRLADARADIRAPFAPLPRLIVLVPARPPIPANGPVTGPPPITPVRPPMVAASAPYGGSLLGMARGSMPPAPRPTPVNATYDSN